jgi:hypothetical protein
LALIGVIVGLIVILPLITIYFHKRCATNGRQQQTNNLKSDWKDVAFDETVSRLPPLREFSTKERNLEPKPGLFLPSIHRQEI